MHPHEFSGGMRQRAMIAMAITCNPDLLIADEPTTALDVTVQAQVLDVLMEMKDEIDSSIVLITHDLGVVAGLADRMIVMYAGREAEVGTAHEAFYDTRHPYTLGLLASMPRLDDAGNEQLRPIRGAPPSLLNPPSGCAFHPRCDFARERCATDVPPLRLVAGSAHFSACHYAEELGNVDVAEFREEAVDVIAPTRASKRASCDRRGGDRWCDSDGAVGDGRPPLMSVRELVKDFSVRGGLFSREVAKVQAVSDVSFDVYPGETLGLVGESGCGKSTTGRLVLRLIQRTSGDVLFEGADISTLEGDALIQFRQQAQIVFQDPYASLNPRKTIERAIGEALRVHRGMSREQARDARPGAAAARRAVARARRPLSPPVLRRPAPARRDRQGAGGRAEVHRPRRAGVGARREHPGRRRQPPRAAAGRARAHLPVHRPRPVRRPPHLRSRRRDVPRQDRRDRHA